MSSIAVSAQYMNYSTIHVYLVYSHEVQEVNLFITMVRLYATSHLLFIFNPVGVNSYILDTLKRKSI